MILKEIPVASPELTAEILKDQVESEDFKGRNQTFSNRRAAPRHRNRGYALEEISHLTDKEFQRKFRLNREALYWLLSSIHQDISPAPSLRQKVLERNIPEARRNHSRFLRFQSRSYGRIRDGDGRVGDEDAMSQRYGSDKSNFLQESERSLGKCHIC